MLYFRESKKNQQEMIRVKYLDCLKTLKLTTIGTVQRNLVREGCSKQGLAAIAVLLAQRFLFCFSPFEFFYSQIMMQLYHFFLLFPNSPNFTSLCFVSKSWPLFFISCCYMHINTCNYTHTSIPKYNLLNLDNLAGMYVFRAGGLG